MNQHIVAALQVRLKAFAAVQIPTLRVAYEMVSFTATATEIYLQDYHLPANTGGPVLANSVAEYVGIYQVDVNAPATADPVVLRRLVDALLAHFPRGLVVTSGGVKVTVKGHPSRGPAIPSSGRTKIPISITYWA
jgi:hypothetical protein